jgi:hypothetical protein
VDTSGRGLQDRRSATGPPKQEDDNQQGKDQCGNGPERRQQQAAPDRGPPRLASVLFSTDGQTQPGLPVLVFHIASARKRPVPLARRPRIYLPV